MMTRETNAFIAPIVLLDEDGVGGNQGVRPGLKTRPYTIGRV